MNHADEGRALAEFVRTQIEVMAGDVEALRNAGQAPLADRMAREVERMRRRVDCAEAQRPQRQAAMDLALADSLDCQS